MRQELFVVPQMSASSQIPEFTVSEVSEALKITIESNFSIIKIKGEISGIKAATSGHVYFNLKDEKSVIKAICWRGVASSLNFKPEDGLEVICTGKLSIYAGGSYYQIVISSIEINGIGALLALLEKRKKQLEEEGLFALERKKPLPFMPKVLGIVTSLTGAVIRDILHRISDRFPLYVIIWPVLVQGQDAAEQIARAIKGFNNLPHHIPTPDTIIVARGGGSIEDLWAFNEEIVVRAAANSKIPLISAVGHETDTTLIDFASDKRAPTPTAAAEISVPVKADLEVTLVSLHNRLNKALPNMIKLLNLKFNELSHALYRAEHILIKTESKLENLQNSLRNSLVVLTQRYENKVSHLAGMLSVKPIEACINLNTNKLESNTHLINMNVTNLIRTNTQRFINAMKLLESYHYKNVLKRGFAIVYDRNDNAISSKNKILPNQVIKIEFQDGQVEAMPNIRKSKPVSASEKSQQTLFQ